MACSLRSAAGRVSWRRSPRRAAPPRRRGDDRAPARPPRPPGAIPRTGSTPRPAGAGTPACRRDGPPGPGRRGFAVSEQQQPPGTERLERPPPSVRGRQAPAPRGPGRSCRPAAPGCRRQVAQQRVHWSEAGRVVVGAEQFGSGIEQPAGAGPRRRADHAERACAVVSFRTRPVRGERARPASGGAGRRTRSVPGPSGVTQVRHTAPSAPTWKAGSRGPRLCTDRTSRMSAGTAGRPGLRVAAAADTAASRRRGCHLRRLSRTGPSAARAAMSRPDPDARRELVPAPRSRHLRR